MPPTVRRVGFWTAAVFSLLALARGIAAEPTVGPPADALEFATDELQYRIGRDGRNRGFVERHTGTDHAEKSRSSSFAVMSLPDGPRTGTVASHEDGRLTLRFGDPGPTATLRVEVRPGYLEFEVREVRDAAGATELSFLNLELDLAGEPGEAFAAVAVDLNAQTFNAGIPGHSRALRIYANAQDGFVGAKFAVLGCRGAALRERLKQVVRDHPELPQTDRGGPWAAEAPIVRGSYLIEMGRMNEANVDDWIAVARSIGARQIDLHCGKTLRFGDLEPNPTSYPGGLAGVKRVVERLHAAGLSAGLHTYAFYLSRESRWVTPIPDERLGKHRQFTLAGELGAAETAVPVKESTAGMSATTGFLIANSATLQIDQELIEFTGVSTNAPFTFTGCKRGAWGTRVASHAAGARVSQLRELFGLFSPDGDSTLFDEVVRRTAEVYNQCGFDMIYLDAIDGAGALAGRHTPGYYQARFIFELTRQLQRPALMEMSAFDSHFWFARSRMGAWDVPSKSYRMFLNRHVADNATYARSFLPRNLGWWAIWDWAPKDRIRMFRDDVEYLLCKSLAAGDSLSWLEAFSPESFSQSPSQRQLAPLIRQYEELRLTDAVPADVRARLGELNRDFRLETAADGGWRFRPVTYERHAVTGMDARDAAWTVTNRYESQPLAVRIEAGLGLARYDDPRGEVIEDFQAPARFVESSTTPGVSAHLRTMNEPAPPGGSSATEFAVATGSSAGGAGWALLGRPLGRTVDFSKRGFGVWVHGDGAGEVLNFMWQAPPSVCMGVDEHYVVVDFHGWRYFEFIEPESDRVGAYAWPHHPSTGVPAVETAWVAYDRIDRFTLGCSGLAAGKTVRCRLGPVKALPHVPVTLRRPTVFVGGHRLTFPVDLASGHYLEFWPPAEAVVHEPQGEVVTTVRSVGEIPLLAAGLNEIRFECGIDQPVNVRAQVTVITRAARTLDP